MTVSGRHFVQSSALSCRFGMASAVAGTFLSTSLVVCKTPERGAGLVNVLVSNNGVDASIGSAHYHYAGQVSASSAVPSRGPTAGGTMVTVNGLLSDDKNSTIYCVFGMTSVTAAKLEGGGASCIAPAASANKVVTLRLQSSTYVTKAGDDLVPESVNEIGTVHFEYFNRPGIHGVLPSSGSEDGGTVMRMTGIDFPKHEAIVRFSLSQGETATVDGHVESSTQISWSIARPRSRYPGVSPSYLK